LLPALWGAAGGARDREPVSNRNTETPRGADTGFTSTWVSVGVPDSGCRAAMRARPPMQWAARRHNWEHVRRRGRFLATAPQCPAYCYCGNLGMPGLLRMGRATVISRNGRKLSTAAKRMETSARQHSYCNHILSYPRACGRGTAPAASSTPGIRAHWSGPA